MIRMLRTLRTLKNLFLYVSEPEPREPEEPVQPEPPVPEPVEHEPPVQPEPPVEPVEVEPEPEEDQDGHEVKIFKNGVNSLTFRDEMKILWNRVNAGEINHINFLLEFRYYQLTYDEQKHLAEFLKPVLSELPDNNRSKFLFLNCRYVFIALVLSKYFIDTTDLVHTNTTVALNMLRLLTKSTSLELPDPINTAVYVRIMINLYNEYRIVNTMKSCRICMNIYDVVAPHLLPANANIMLDEIRQMEQRILGIPLSKIKTTIRTVYSDSQNVHNSDINRNCLNKVNLLMREYASMEQITYESICRDICIKYRSSKTIVGEVIYFIKINTSHFGDGHKLRDIFNAICNYILILKNTNKEKYNNMIDNLHTEILSMHNYCATGHLTRLMNVFNGFDERFTVYVADTDRNLALIKAYLDQYVKNDEAAYDIIIMGGDTSPLYKPMYTTCVEELKDEDIPAAIISDTVKRYLGIPR
jgi:hypothetical protein